MGGSGKGNSMSDNMAWLKPLLKTEFYTLCECESGKQCNFYCRDCMASPFCEDCFDHPDKHEGHQCLRVYKSSSRPGIRIPCIRDMLDVSDIQQYTCNSFKLVYINRKRREEHDQNRIKNNNNNGRKGDKCYVCRYELLCSAFKFCSIECKVGIEVDLQEESEKEEDVNATSTACKHVVPVNNNSSRKRKRKGIPERSPYF